MDVGGSLNDLLGVLLEDVLQLVICRAMGALTLQGKSLVKELWCFGKPRQVLEVLNTEFQEVQSRVGSPNQNSVQIPVQGKNSGKLGRLTDT